MAKTHSNGLVAHALLAPPARIACEELLRPMCSVIHAVLVAAVSTCLMACGDFQDRLSGYPKADTVVHVESATSTEIAEALSRLARASASGGEWEFLNPHDLCTVHVATGHPQQAWPLQLQGAQFTLHRDRHTHHYYATLQHGETPALDPQGQPLRLFEGDNYHNVFFAEGYLQALAHKCAQSQPLHVAGPMEAAYGSYQ